MNSKYMTNGALLVGPVIESRKVLTGETLGVLPENRELLVTLAQKYRLRRHEDGWFVDGRGHRSQIWEFGVGKLGLTVTGSQFIRKCREAGDWLRAKAVGDREANFYCDWTDANLAKLVTLTGLQRRKSAPAPR